MVGTEHKNGGKPMNLTDLVPKDIRGFAEELTKLEIREVEIPKLCIPN